MEALLVAAERPGLGCALIQTGLVESAALTKDKVSILSVLRPSRHPYCAEDSECSAWRYEIFFRTDSAALSALRSLAVYILGAFLSVIMGLTCNYP